LIDHLEIVIPLIAGFILDVFIGDPHWLPHPIRLFGNAISFGEKKLNRGKRRKLKGAILALSLVLTSFLAFESILKLSRKNK